MLAIAIGLSKMSGTSKKSGSAYAMQKLCIMVPTKNHTSATYNRLAFGYEPLDLDIAEHAFAKFQQLTYPCKIDLTMDHEARAGKVQTVVSGYTGQALYIDVSESPAAAAPSKATV